MYTVQQQVDPDTIFFMVRNLVRAELQVLQAWTHMEQEADKRGYGVVFPEDYDDWLHIAVTAVASLKWLLSLSPNREGDLPKRWLDLQDEVSAGVGAHLMALSRGQDR